jgi:hypothetical protein
MFPRSSSGLHQRPIRLDVDVGRLELLRRAAPTIVHYLDPLLNQFRRLEAPTSVLSFFDPATEYVAELVEHPPMLRIS